MKVTHAYTTETLREGSPRRTIFRLLITRAFKCDTRFIEDIPPYNLCGFHSIKNTTPFPKNKNKTHERRSFLTHSFYTSPGRRRIVGKHDSWLSRARSTCFRSESRGWAEDAGTEPRSQSPPPGGLEAAASHGLTFPSSKRVESTRLLRHCVACRAPSRVLRGPLPLTPVPHWPLRPGLSTGKPGEVGRMAFLSRRRNGRQVERQDLLPPRLRLPRALCLSLSLCLSVCLSSSVPTPPPVLRPAQLWGPEHHVSP